MRYVFIVLAALWGTLAFGDELIIFHLPGCRPCAHFKAMLDENPELTRGFRVSYINIGDDGESAKLFKVNSVPTVVRLDDTDTETARMVGYDGKRAFEQWLKTPKPAQRMFQRFRH